MESQRVQTTDSRESGLVSGRGDRIVTTDPFLTSAWPGIREGNLTMNIGTVMSLLALLGLCIVALVAPRSDAKTVDDTARELNNPASSLASLGNKMEIRAYERHRQDCPPPGGESRARRSAIVQCATMRAKRLDYGSTRCQRGEPSMAPATGAGP